MSRKLLNLVVLTSFCNNVKKVGPIVIVNKVERKIYIISGESDPAVHIHNIPLSIKTKITLIGYYYQEVIMK